MGKGLVNDGCNHDDDDYTYFKTLFNPLSDNIWLIYHCPKSIKAPQPQLN